MFLGRMDTLGNDHTPIFAMSGHFVLGDNRHLSENRLVCGPLGRQLTLIRWPISVCFGRQQTLIRRPISVCFDPK